jgi:hypothetical protein
MDSTSWTGNSLDCTFDRCQCHDDGHVPSVFVCIQLPRGRYCSLLHITATSTRVQHNLLLAYLAYASSALSGQSFLREYMISDSPLFLLNCLPFLGNVMAAVFPLFTRQVVVIHLSEGHILITALQMYRNLSFHWASTVFASISVLLLFVPFVLISWGEVSGRSPSLPESSSFISRKYCRRFARVPVSRNSLPLRMCTQTIKMSGSACPVLYAHPRCTLMTKCQYWHHARPC